MFLDPLLSPVGGRTRLRFRQDRSIQLSVFRIIERPHLPPNPGSSANPARLHLHKEPRHGYR